MLHGSVFILFLKTDGSLLYTFPYMRQTNISYTPLIKKAISLFASQYICGIIDEDGVIYIIYLKNIDAPTTVLCFDCKRARAREQEAQQRFQ